ncbi:MAG: DUF2017 family protein [Terrimicrobiaceae bacterium]
MTLSATDEGALALEEIPPFLFQLLKEVPDRGASDDPRVESRFYPAPGQDELLVEDWKSLIQPELYELFLSAREVVQTDLATASEESGTFAMEIPKNHMDSWLSALNQARLAIAGENQFEEKDMAEDLAPDPSDTRSLALFEISFFGFLQECLVKMQD